MKTLLLFFIFLTTLFAHPHTFIEVYPTIKQKGSNIDHIHFKWEIDEMTSAILIMEFDQNFNGKIDKEENEFIKENYFKDLANYNYYTDIKIDKKVIVTKPRNITATIENGKVCYNFEIHINSPKEKIELDFYDEDRFVAMILKKEFVKSKLSYSIKDVDNDIYFAYRLSFN